MKILTIVIVLAVCSNAEINKLFFSGPNIYIDCPGEGTFFQWKKYYLDQKTNLFSDDKRRLNVPLNPEFSPITYECYGTNGFINYNKNITIFVLDQQSTQARKLCFIRKYATKVTAQYPCFLSYQNEPLVRAIEGSTVSLNCEAGGVNVTYIWYKLNTPNSHQELLHNFANVPVLKIDKIDDKLAGQFLCIVNTTSGDNLKRFFDLQIIKQTKANVILINGPSVSNVTVKRNRSHKLTCEGEALEPNTIHLIQWAKKINSDFPETEKNLVIKWGDTLYKLIPESQVQSSAQAQSVMTTSLTLDSISRDSAGQYICAFFTNVGKMTHKTFMLKVDESESGDGQPRSFLFLYILIPFFIIAICIFVGIYMAVSRFAVRKASSSGTGTMATNSCKSDCKETIRLRNTPDYSVNSYPCKGPPTSQYMSNNSSYPGQYFPAHDNLIL